MKVNNICSEKYLFITQNLQDINILSHFRNAALLARNSQELSRTGLRADVNGPTPLPSSDHVNQQPRQSSCKNGLGSSYDTFSSFFIWCVIFGCKDTWSPLYFFMNSQCILLEIRISMVLLS